MNKKLTATLAIGAGVGFFGGTVQGMLSPIVGSFGSWAAAGGAAFLLSYVVMEYIVK